MERVSQVIAALPASALKIAALAFSVLGKRRVFCHKTVVALNMHRLFASSVSVLPPAPCAEFPLSRRAFPFRRLSWLALLAWALLSVSHAQDFSYTTNGGAVTITGYSGVGGAVNIPATLAGLPVTRIGDYAFYNRSAVTGLSIPASVTNLGNYAFSYCANLAGVTVPNSVRVLGNNAFSYCFKLASATVGTNVTVIGTQAFFGCTNLTSVSLGGRITTLGNYAFAHCRQLPGITIPNSVTSIGYQCFYGCTNLTTIAMGSGLIVIGDAAFANCGRLAAVTIPDGVINIGNSAFSQCTALGSISLGANLYTLGAQLLVGCSNLTAITVSPLNPTYASQDGVLLNKSLTTLLLYPPGKAGAYMVPGSVTNISASAFLQCGRLTGVTLGTAVTAIGNNAFEACTGLTQVNLPASLASLGYRAFYACTNLTAITVPSANLYFFSQEGVLFDKAQTVLLQYPPGRAGGYALPGSVSTINSSAFAGCHQLTSVVLPNALRTIGTWAFHDCTSLTEVILPPSVTLVGAFAFERCAALVKVSLGGVNVRLGDYAFSECSQLTTFWCLGNPPALDADVFNNTTNVTIYYLPGVIGWSALLGGRPTELLRLPYPLVLTTASNFGVSAGQFNFTVAWATNATLVVESSTSLANPTWTPVATNTLQNGAIIFSDAHWPNTPTRFYRLRQL